MNKLPYSRRKLLKTMAVGTLVGQLGVTTASATEEPSLSHSGTIGSRKFDDGKVSVGIGLSAKNVDLDTSNDRVLRIKDSYGQSVRVVPESDELIDLLAGGDIDIYDGEGKIKDEPVLVSSDTIPVDVTGDTSMFADNPIFTPYTVQLVEGDKTIVSTDEYIYGIGHPTDAFSQDSTSGEIEVTYERTDLIDASWTLILKVVDYDLEDGSIQQSLRSGFEYEDGTFVTTINTDRIDPLAAGDFRDTDVYFYDRSVDPDEHDVLSEDTSLWGLADITIDDSDPPETGTVDGTVTDNVGGPLSDITVEFVNVDTEAIEGTTSTDEDGEYSIELAAGQTYEVVIEADAFDPFSTEVAVESDETQTVDITLTADEEDDLIDAPGGVEIPATYTDEDGTVGPVGLGNAAADFRSGTLDPGTLGDVAAAFRNS